MCNGASPTPSPRCVRGNETDMLQAKQRDGHWLAIHIPLESAACDSTDLIGLRQAGNVPSLQVRQHAAQRDSLGDTVTHLHCVRRNGAEVSAQCADVELNLICAAAGAS